ncbi:uncharacterized protein LOC122014085 [Zingiber officinale]|uniref:uncharacterized protein LOC122014085 n=1 Tax=Zingiber officinale TaxID=94328 RepID=UPI001C4D0BCA|nr:uncharacterized protein LOC122014085 [Zingiber officinale]
MHSSSPVSDFFFLVPVGAISCGCKVGHSCEVGSDREIRANPDRPIISGKIRVDEAQFVHLFSASSRDRCRDAAPSHRTPPSIGRRVHLPLHLRPIDPLHLAHLHPVTLLHPGLIFLPTRTLPNANSTTTGTPRKGVFSLWSSPSRISFLFSSSFHDKPSSFQQQLHHISSISALRSMSSWAFPASYSIRTAIFFIHLRSSSLLFFAKSAAIPFTTRQLHMHLTEIGIPRANVALATSTKSKCCIQNHLLIF